MIDRNDDTLDALLDQAARAPRKAPDALMARIIADAAAEQSARAARGPARRNTPGRAVRLLAVIGGWPALTGMAAATLTGIWIGVSPPSPVEDIGGVLFETTAAEAFSDVFPGFDSFLAEG